MMIRTNAASYRKEMVKALAELLGHEPRYCKAPTFAYEFNIGTLDRDATLHLLPSLNVGAAEQLARHLEVRGFICKIEDDGCSSEIEQASPVEEANYYTVCIGGEKLTPDVFAKVEAIVAGKATLLRKALGDSPLEIRKTTGSYEFLWFQIESTPEEREAYAILIEKLIAFAGTLHRVTAKDKHVDNEKYAMRCFLLRLGFIGEEYKKARAILLRNLEGNSAFRSGTAPKHTHKAESEQLSNQAEQE